MVDSVVVFTGGPSGSGIALKVSAWVTRTPVRDALSEVVNDWLCKRGASNVGVPTGLTEPTKCELTGTPQELAESLIHAAAASGLTLSRCEIDDTVFVIALVYCRPKGSGERDRHLR